MFIFKSKARGIVDVSCLIVTGRDGHPPMQSISDNEDGTYAPIRPPSLITADMPSPCSGPQQLITGD